MGSAGKEPSSVIKAYDHFAEWFEAIEAVHYDHSWTKGLACFIRDLKPDTTSVLDCACGLGSMGFDLFRMGFDVTCSDASSRMVEIGKKNIKKGQRIEFLQSTWEDLDADVPGTFDCVINLGISIYHVHGGNLLAALRGMKAKLKPGGLLLLDNKNWLEVCRVGGGRRQLCLVEKRQIVRVFNDTPLPGVDGQAFYFLDIAWSEGRKWMVSVFRLPAQEVNGLLEKKNSIFLNIDGHTVSIGITGGALHAEYRRKAQNAGFDRIRHERILLPGWPVLSSHLASLLEEIGLMDTKIYDKYLAIPGKSSSRVGLYHMIAAFNPKQNAYD